ncbi:hypothetical protein MPLB_2040033 [Mesorhizobium sp. ORS 3324]|nr:hypothetical protein MPLB_2040033 [Mesorhizobium sp. ORS 3324]
MVPRPPKESEQLSGSSASGPAVHAKWLPETAPVDRLAAFPAIVEVERLARIIAQPRIPRACLSVQFPGLTR